MMTRSEACLHMIFGVSSVFSSKLSPIVASFQHPRRRPELRWKDDGSDDGREKIDSDALRVGVFTNLKKTP